MALFTAFKLNRLSTAASAGVNNSVSGLRMWRLETCLYSENDYVAGANQKKPTDPPSSVAPSANSAGIGSGLSPEL